MRKTAIVLIVVCFLVTLSLPVAAKQSESVDPGYDFAKVRTILIIEPTFTYGEVNGDNRFVTYPDAAGKIAAILNGKLKKAGNLRYVTMDYVAERVKADPDLEIDPKSPEFAALVKRELPKHVDLVLELTIRNFGWLHQYVAAYEAWETVTDRVRWSGKTADGKDISGYKEIERQVLVYHPAHYEIQDCAEANFRLLNPRTGKYVWSFSDIRSRLSPGGNSGYYDRTGPESMMNRIFDDAVDRMPIYPKEKSAVQTYN